MNVDVLNNFVAGFLSSGFGTLTGQPFDVVKVKQQAADCRQSSLRILIETVRYEGATGLLRGLVPPLVGQGAFASVNFAGFNLVLAKICGLEGVDRQQLSSLIVKEQADLKHLFAAGCVSGALSTLVTTPFDLVKVKLQTEKPKSNRLVLGSSRRLIALQLRTRGFRGLYSGWGITLCREVPSVGVYFASYYKLKNRIKDLTNGRQTITEVMAGGIAGMLSWTVSIPFDIVKTRQQIQNFELAHNTKPITALTIASEVWQKEGVAGFGRGAFPLVLRAFPVNAVSFFAYERISDILYGNQ